MQDLDIWYYAVYISLFAPGTKNTHQQSIVAGADQVSEAELPGHKAWNEWDNVFKDIVLLRVKAIASVTKMASSTETQPVRPSIPDDVLVLYVKKGIFPVQLGLFKPATNPRQNSEPYFHRKCRETVDADWSFEHTTSYSHH